MAPSTKKQNFRHLGSLDRTGGHIRRLVFNTVRDFVRPNWAILLAMVVLPGSLGYLTTLLMSNSERFKWAYVGATGASGFWIVTILIIIWTGIGNPLMGLQGENRTAEILRKFQSEGWQLVNGMQLLGDWDIDHVLVGPAGVLVFESKWSHKVWPSHSNGKGYMAARLREAISQVTDNREQFKSYFKKDLFGVTVTPVCVLWSHEYDSDEPTTFLTGGVVVIHGPALKKWMESLTAKWLDSGKVEKISTVLDLQTSIRDKREAMKPDAPIPTFSTYVKDNVFARILGFVVVVYGISISTRHQSLWINVLVFTASSAFGVWLLRKMHWRRLAQGWLTACFLYFCLFVISLIQAFTR